MSEPNLVKCIDCGFTSKRTETMSLEFPSLTYFEIARDERKSRLQFASIYQFAGSQRKVVTILACYCHEHELDNEAKIIQSDTQRSYSDCAMTVLQAERGCASWCPHIPGRSPEKHYDMIENQKLFQITQKIQEDAITAANRNLAATIIFGIIVVILSFMQWWATKHPAPQAPIIIQMPDRENTKPVQP